MITLGRAFVLTANVLIPPKHFDCSGGLAAFSFFLNLSNYVLLLIVQVVRAEFVFQVLMVSSFFILLASYTVKVIYYFFHQI